MPNTQYVELHNHSEYSLLDGMSRIVPMVRRIKELGMPAIALTDHGNMFGAVQFYKECKREGVKPILGCEVYVAHGSRFDNGQDTKTSKRHSSTTYQQRPEPPYDHLTLLCETYQGYLNLIKLCTLAYTEGFYYKPRIDLESLEKYNDGLICLTGCLGGSFAKAIIQDCDAYTPINTLRFFITNNRLFLEVQDHNLAHQQIVKDEVLAFSREFQIPIVATNDCHYINKDDAISHDIMLCCQTHSTINQEGRFKFGAKNEMGLSSEWYIKSPEAMRTLFKDIPEACNNTLKITERCNVELPIGSFHMPKFFIDGVESTHTDLINECRKRFTEKFPHQTSAEVDRIKYEFQIIEKMGFSSYFLILADLSNYCRNNNIIRGNGRGSACGSVVSYVLGITDINPLRYGLLFERFLNLQRKAFPDIDIDVSSSDRERVLNYLKEKYGDNYVSQICTFGKMSGRQVIKDVGRALEIPLKEVASIALMVPDEYGKRVLLQQIIDYNPVFKDTINHYPNFLKHCISLENTIKYYGKHASGVVISPKPLDELAPLAFSTNDNLMTQYDMYSLEDLGLLKIDILGVRTLDVVRDTLNLLRQQGRQVNMSLNDDRAFRLINKGWTYGVFQMGSWPMTEAAMKIGIHSINDIADVIALYRPGPMDWIPDYIERKHQRQYWKYDYPKLEPILQSTYGIPVYQEQVMQIMVDLGGFSLAEGYDFIKMVGKKQVDRLSVFKDKFLSFCLGFGSREEAEKYFDKLSGFAHYAFNLSHAIAYAHLTYQTAWLKACFPLEYMLCLLNNDATPAKVKRCETEITKIGIKLLPISYNYSDYYYGLEGSSIRKGFIGVNGIGKLAGEEIMEKRIRIGQPESLEDFEKSFRSRVVNKRVFAAIKREIA